MLDNYYKKALHNLEKFSIPFLLKSKLESKYKPIYRSEEDQKKSDVILQEINQRNKEKIKYLEKITKKCKLAETRNETKNFEEVALEASVYFQQSYEMFRTSLSMNENSSPLVEYYALLQCVKGSILLKYELDKKHFFNHHGLTVDGDFKAEKPYVFAKNYKRGVFFGLVLLFCEKDSKGFSKIDDYLSSSYHPSLIEVIKGCRPIDTFVGSWMLSSIVRYQPKLWLKILSGRKDDIIDSIREFRSNCIPKLVEQLLWDFGYL